MRFKIVDVSVRLLIILLFIAAAIFFFIDFYGQSKRSSERVNLDDSPVVSTSDTYLDLFKKDADILSSFTFTSNTPFPIATFYLDRPEYYLIVTKNELADTNINLSQLIKKSVFERIKIPMFETSRTVLDFNESVFRPYVTPSRIRYLNMHSDSSDFRLLKSSENAIEYSGTMHSLTLKDENSNILLYTIHVAKNRYRPLNILFLKKDGHLYTILKFPVSSLKGGPNIFDLLEIK